MLCGFVCVLIEKVVIGYVLIVEIKKVSFLKGLIWFDFDLFVLVCVY